MPKLTFDFCQVLHDVESLIERQQPLASDGTKVYHSAEELFNDPEFHDFMQDRWPIAAQLADNMCLQNGKLAQECGKKRESALCHLLSLFLGENYENCYLDTYSIGVTEHGKDTVLFGRDVSIKTISFKGKQFNQLKVSWVEDKEMAAEFEKTWQPTYDLLLCRLKWGSDDEGIYYITKEVQKDVLDQFRMAEQPILKTSKRYGKGTSLTQAVCEAFVTHIHTLKLKINMPQEKRDDNVLPSIFDWGYRRAKIRETQDFALDSADSFIYQCV